MAPIYKLFMGKWSEAWYQLSEAERTALFSKVEQALTDVGGKPVIICNAAWASEQCQFFGIAEYPNLEAVQQESQVLDELNWLRYVETMTFLGTNIEVEGVTLPAKDG